MTRSRAVPLPFLLPGAAGLLPFIGGALGAWLAPEADRSVVLYWLSGYAMVILAFVGALHWGVVMMDAAATRRAQWLATLWSVTPALIAWAALQLPTVTGLRLMAGAFVLQYVMDRQLAARHPVPAWFLPLRAGLTAVVVIALVVATLR
jgi:Protein of unknown function (DUF3429)